MLHIIITQPHRGIPNMKLCRTATKLSFRAQKLNVSDVIVLRDAIFPAPKLFRNLNSLVYHWARKTCVCTHSDNVLRFKVIGYLPVEDAITKTRANEARHRSH